MTEDQLLDYSDYPRVRQDLRDKVLQAVQEAPPAENDRFLLRIVNPKFSGKDRHSLKEQKKAIISGHTLSDNLVGNYELVDKETGDIVGRTNQKRIMNVPYLTDHGTYIRNGVEYTIAKQFRLVPGVYTRTTDDGYVESQFNAKPRTGPSFRTYMEPDSGFFYMKYKGRKIPLYPVMRAMGMEPEQMEQHWGKELADKNKTLENSPYAIQFLKQFRPQRDDAKEEIMQAMGQQKEASGTDYNPEMRQNLLNEFAKTELSPRVTRRTLGKEFTNVTPDAIITATRKILDINRGKGETDSRDSLAYQDIYDISDFLSEKIKNDQGGALRKVLWKLTGKNGDMSKIPPSVLDAHVKHLFTATGVAQAIEEINPSDIYDQNMRVSRLGEGALPSIDSAPKECFSEDTEVFTSIGWVRWQDVDEYTEFACLSDKDALMFSKADRLMSYDYDGDMYGLDNRSLSYLVTPNHRMWVRKCRNTADKKRLGGEAPFYFERADETHNSPRMFRIGSEPYKGKSHKKTFSFPKVVGARSEYSDISWSDIGAFMGWYLSEGSIDSYARRVRSKYHITISQDAMHEDNCKEIDDLLTRMGIPHSKQSWNFVFVSKQIGTYLEKWGDKAHTKKLLDEIFEWPVEARRSFIDAYCKGDGHKAGEDTGFCLLSCSEDLVEGLERVLISLGYATTRSINRTHEDPCHRDLFQVYALTKKISGVAGKPQYGSYRVTRYSGKVYCAQVPGERLLTRRMGKSPIWLGNSRNVQPSYFGYIDPVVAPESLRIGLDMRLARNVRRGKDRQLYTKLIDARTGKPEWVGVRDATEKTIGIPGSSGPYDRFVPAMSRGRQMVYVDRKAVDYMLPSGDEMFSDTANMVPLKSGVKGMRLLMGNKFARQALPLVKREAPLVQTLSSEGISEEERMGKFMGAVKARKPGIIKSVYKDHIKVVNDDGTEDEFDLYDNYPYSRKTFIRNMAQVKAGQRVRPGEVLATSNYTDGKGTSALGTNMRVAYLNYDGKVFEDAVVISSGAAKKMTSEHMYTTKFEKDKDLDTSKKKFLALFPSKFDKSQLGRLDENGVIKPGTVVQYGDPLVIAVREREPTPQSMGRRLRTDESVIWKHRFPAVVTDAEPSKKGYNINVRANTPMEAGDKLCYASDTDILTRSGWKCVTDITLDDEVASLNSEGFLEYLHPAAVHIYRHTGRMYHLNTTQVNLLVTENHKNYVRKRSSKSYGFVPAVEHFGKCVRMLKSAEWAGSTPSTIEIPEIRVVAGQWGKGFRYMPKIELDPMTYAMLLGMFLSEGNIVNHPSSGTYGIDITQIKKKSRERMLKALDKAGVVYCEQDHGRKIRIHSKQLMLHFEVFGKSWEKFIPDEVFSYGKDFLKELYSWMMWGDGSEKRSGHSYCTTSRRLADDVQRLCLHIGYSAGIDVTSERYGVIKGKEYLFRERYDVRIYRKKNRPTINHSHVSSQNGQTEEWVHYDGTVHCVTMPRNHVVYTRRKGKTVWSGNSGRFGNKGVVSEVIPDEDMPRDAKGRPIDVIFSPLGIHSRTNPSQKVEAVLGKVAEKTGKPFILPGFMDEDMKKLAEEEARKHGLRPNEDLIDPRTGKTIPGILTGMSYIYKLQHTAEGKGKARSTSHYTAEDQPAKGGKEGAKHLGDMEIQALMAHGADKVLKDLKIIKGQKNDEFWRQLKLGQTPTQPDTPMVYQKFKSLIRAAGINLHEDRHKDNIYAMTNSQAEELTGAREIKNASTYDAKNLRPIKGGLFDPEATGSMGRGDRWGFIKLPEPMPNPIMAEPMRRILGMKQKEFDALVGGETAVEGKYGAEAVSHLLSRLNLQSLKEQTLQQIRTGVKSKRDDAVKLFRYIDSMEKHGVRPQDFMMTRVPVLPPMFRPITRHSDMTMVADPNYLYKNMLESIEDYKDTKNLPREIQNEAWGEVWKSYKTLVGMTDPDQQQLQQKNVGGILKQIFGKGSPKYGFVQRRVIGTNIDVSGLGVVTPNPSLKLNQIGMPESLAWKLYDPFIVREMVQKGYPATQAAKAVEDHSPAAFAALNDIIKERPVLVNRAPTLHKYSNMAFHPVLTKGKTIQVSPAIVAPFNMDFDGDTASFTVPVSKAAVDQAKEKMMPEKNLLSSRFGKPAYVPSNEYLQGLYFATKPPKKKPAKLFKTLSEAMQAYRKGEISIDDPIRVVES